MATIIVFLAVGFVLMLPLKDPVRDPGQPSDGI